MRARHLLAASLTLLLLPGCAGSTRERAERPAARASADLITREELANSQSPNLFEHIQAHRPNWLRTRGPASLSQHETIMVYIDRVRFGPPESLRQISVQSAERVRFHSAAAAQQEFGQDNRHGVIQVISRTR